MDSPDASNELVVVIHGFGGKRIWMQPLTHRLKRNYRVINWTYFSIAGSIESHARRFSQFLFDLKHDGPIHIVAHSMGSIVTRAAIQLRKIVNLKRIVLLAPPNSGSPVAKVMSFGLGWACRPFRDLSSSSSSFVNKLTTELPCQTGVIAARFDIQVPVSSTHMPGLADHATILGTHNSLLFSAKATRMVTQFLETGRFGCDGN